MENKVIDVKVESKKYTPTHIAESMVIIDSKSIVIAKGSAVKNFEEGDMILYAPYLGHMIIGNETQYTVIKEDDIFAKVEENEKGILEL